MAKHIDILAIGYVCWGLFNATMAAVVSVVLFAMGGGLGFAGATSGDEEAVWIAVFYAVFGALMAVYLLFMAIVYLGVALGLRKRKRWARYVGMFLAALAGISFPHGTVLCIYGLFVLLDADVAVACEA